LMGADDAKGESSLTTSWCLIDQGDDQLKIQRLCLVKASWGALPSYRRTANLASPSCHSGTWIIYVVLRMDTWLSSWGKYVQEISYV
jgi:hypothetical protein